jgi:hypothetical protein
MTCPRPTFLPHLYVKNTPETGENRARYCSQEVRVASPFDYCGAVAEAHVVPGSSHHISRRPSRPPAGARRGSSEPPHARGPGAGGARGARSVHPDGSTGGRRGSAPGATPTFAPMARRPSRCRRRSRYPSDAAVSDPPRLRAFRDARRPSRAPRSEPTTVRAAHRTRSLTLICWEPRCPARRRVERRWSWSQESWRRLRIHRVAPTVAFDDGGR